MDLPLSRSRRPGQSLASRCRRLPCSARSRQVKPRSQPDIRKRRDQPCDVWATGGLKSSTSTKVALAARPRLREKHCSAGRTTSFVRIRAGLKGIPMSRRLIKSALFSSSILLGAGLASPALAQDEPEGPGVQTAESIPAEETSQGDIVVTGTLIKNPNLTSSA